MLLSVWLPEFRTASEQLRNKRYRSLLAVRFSMSTSSCDSKSIEPSGLMCVIKVTPLHPERGSSNPYAAKQHLVIVRARRQNPTGMPGAPDLTLPPSPDFYQHKPLVSSVVEQCFALLACRTTSKRDKVPFAAPGIDVLPAATGATCVDCQALPSVSSDREGAWLEDICCHLGER
ncbi:hypothetical protein D3C71_1509030 [compost metagenome]